MNSIDKIKELIQPAIEEIGYLLDSITFEKEGNTNFLRVIIDKKGFVTIEDCVIVCKTINPIIDDADLIKYNYILDVCSKEKGSEYDEQ